MIVSPDFFEHWKTKALIELSQRAESPLWVMRLWAHCQTRQEYRFRLPTIALKAICAVPTEITAQQWFDWLLECQFIEGTPEKWTVHGWAEANASLVSRWFNGRQAKTKRKGSGDEAEKKRKADSVEDKRREEKRREEGEEGGGKPGARPADLAETKAYFLAHEGNESEAEDFFLFYESNGWKTNTGRLLASWPAAAQRWIRGNRARVSSPSGPKKFGLAGGATAPTNPAFATALPTALNDWPGGAFPDQAPSAGATSL
jgi:hypothetical protein